MRNCQTIDRCGPSCVATIAPPPKAEKQLSAFSCLPDRKAFQQLFARIEFPQACSPPGIIRFERGVAGRRSEFGQFAKQYA